MTCHHPYQSGSGTAYPETIMGNPGILCKSARGSLTRPLAGNKESQCSVSSHASQEASENIWGGETIVDLKLIAIIAAITISLGAGNLYQYERTQGLQAEIERRTELLENCQEQFKKAMASIGASIEYTEAQHEITKNYYETMPERPNDGPHIGDDSGLREQTTDNPDNGDSPARGADPGTEEAGSWPDQGVQEVETGETDDTGWPPRWLLFWR